MQIEYMISPDDYLQSNKLWMKSGGLKRRINSWCSSWFAVLIGLVLIAESLLLIFIAPASRLTDSLLLLLGVYLAALPLLYKRRVKRLYRMQKLDAQFRIDLAEDGVLSTRIDGSAETKYTWPAFDKYLESANLFLLFRSQLQFIPIPKRAMTPEQQTELRNLLQAHIPSK